MRVATYRRRNDGAGKCPSPYGRYSFCDILWLVLLKVLYIRFPFGCHWMSELSMVKICVSRKGLCILHTGVWICFILSFIATCSAIREHLLAKFVVATASLTARQHHRVFLAFPPRNGWVLGRHIFCWNTVTDISTAHLTIKDATLINTVA